MLKPESEVKPTQEAVPAPRFRVLIGGENLSGSSPLADSGTALSAAGIDVSGVSDIDGMPPDEWRRLCREHDVLIFIRYSARALTLRRQLRIARDENMLIVRLWAGTDAWLAAKDPVSRKSASRLAKLTDLNIASSKFVRRRLQKAGIASAIVPPRADVVTDPSLRDEPLPPAVLTYLLNHRQTFYGLPYIRAAAEALPHIPFIVVGDDEHLLGDLPNVESLGFVRDLDQVWPRVGCLVRMTGHDSAPRMIESALSWGCYVIFNKTKAGCWLANTEEELIAALRTFSQLDCRNPDAPTFSEDDRNQHAEMLIEEIEWARSTKERPGWQKLHILMLEVQKLLWRPFSPFRWRIEARRARRRKQLEKSRRD